jgi:hypothetical protein
LLNVQAGLSIMWLSILFEALVIAATGALFAVLLDGVAAYITASLVGWSVITALRSDV